ncbi:penicillin-binding transpeptidase domain-containing protein [Sanguibacter sp. 25GB23B1]|uniref:penicillin-binding transpeptidase domain-containing protein n=1 Tax=unclassified Sanguibacter TaxID=2645534 RepID=UPI0032AF519D
MPLATPLPVRTRTPARPRLVSLALVAVLAGAGLAACGPDTPAPSVAAEALAAGMASGDLSGVTFDGATTADATAHRTAVIEPLVDATVEVSVGKVALGDEDVTATADLVYEWDLGGTPWSYTTSADLALVEDTWHVAWEPELLVPGLVLGDRLQVTRTPAVRGDINGDGDVALVTERAVTRIGIDKTRLGANQWDDAARLLAPLVTIDVEAYAAKVAAAGEKAYVEAITLRPESPYDWTAIAASPGVLLVEDTMPLAPTREFAAAILGRAGDATAEIVEESGGTVAAGDLVGTSGLQRQYDEQLRGTPGLSVDIVGSDGVVRETAFNQVPVDGEPLRTTLNVDLQSAAETILAGTTVPAAIVAIRPSTGGVLVAASSPGSAGLSTATVGMYAPGSTFKVISSLALLRAGVTPETTLQCPASTVVDGRTFTNFPDYPTDHLGDIPLSDAVAQSCNTAFINASGTVTQAQLVDAAASLGIGLAAQPGPGVFTGVVPAGSTGTEHAASMIGQGKVQASPLTMAGVAASVARGETVRPTFLAQEVPEGEASELPTVPKTPLTADEAAQLRALMRGVVTDGGGAFLQDVPGEVAAKTGTAQYGDGSTNHVWMIAIQGDLAVAVFVETGEYGSTTAGPLLEQFLTSAG